jgi:hypothetical protein
MSHELRNCEMEITQVIRNVKLDTMTFRNHVKGSLDSAGQFSSDRVNGIRLLCGQGRYDEAVEEVEKVRSKLI